ncbi:concanavalin A-like lectin/glucanase domain-containing protein [Polychytrium aggregatum]|uniref:concanavalin A-like lectin/glucanase domain-containing protein n=1 Tax=Polychytrium aggregatum TaxID=110093 RepID=UPI0022FDBEB8|nr:concanavalin A-like lectin/glucanase domain-containing protein [Polychytrium aggregatum]KAI9206818.1 concanavalin A-like lectin/glucanase domain-containing protein [Polychytrium aggregatum]
MLIVPAAVFLVAAAAASQAQSLFAGSACSLNIPSFSSLPSDLVLENGKVDYSNGTLIMTMLPPPAGATEGENVLISSKLSLLYGTIEADVKQSSVGGAITAFTLFNGTSKDEIDYEWVGNDRMMVWTNFFFRGLRERNPVTTFEIWSSSPAVATDTYLNFHNYKVDWTPYAITWYVDGAVVHSQNRSGTWEPAGTGDGYGISHYHYPDTPLQIQLGIWNDNEVPWANGPLDWSAPGAQNGYTAEFKSLKVTCYTGPYPSNMSAPPTDPSSSDQKGTAPVIQGVVPPSVASPSSVAASASAAAGATSTPTTGHAASGAATTGLALAGQLAALALGVAASYWML